MGRLPLDPVISAKLELRVQRLRSEYHFASEAVVALTDRARRILEARIHPAISPYDPSVNPENWCEGVGPIVDATIWQACIDAGRASGICNLSRS